MRGPGRKGYTSRPDSTARHMPMFKAPHGLNAIIDRYGDPRKYRRDDGTLSPNWEREHITRIRLPEPLRLDFKAGDDEPLVSRVAVHIRLADHALETLEAVHERGLWEQLGGFSGGFEPRTQRNSRKMSLHTWGVAFDFGASRDPLGDRVIDMPLAIVDVFEAYGWEWGGRWQHRPDAMHFQYAMNY